MKAAQELYDELEATQMHKAKNIKEEDLARALQFVKDSGANREATCQTTQHTREDTGARR
jgi:hypothetical protein